MACLAAGCPPGWVFATFALVILATPSLAQTTTNTQLLTAQEVRQLTPRQAAEHIPVRLQGVVTFSEELLHSRFIQDSTAGIYLQMEPNPVLACGQEVEVEGVSSPGEYAPVVSVTSVKVLGEGIMPQATPVSVEQLVSGHEDSQFVELSAIVRAVRLEADSQEYLLDLVAGGERFSAYARTLPLPKAEELVDSTVKIRGVCSTLFNRQRQLFGFRLLVPRESDLVIEKPAPAKPFDIPAQDIRSLLQFTSQGSFGHRVKVTGTVSYHEPGEALFIQDENEGLYCQTLQRSALQPGDRVEVLGFPAKGEYTPVLQDALYRKTGPGVAPAPAAIELDEALAGTYDCRLVQLRAKLLEHTGRGREQFLVLEKNGVIFHAYHAQDYDGTGFAAVPNGSEVSVVGICQIERGSTWRAGEAWRAKAFRILLRSPRDVAVLNLPPWWTLKKVLWIAAALGLVALAGFSWAGVLRHRVRQQTGIIRERLQTEAALKERYEVLFENANDMVFTHDLSGRITSINKTGERLLQRARASILGQNVVALLVEEHRTPARLWLDQIIKGADLPTAEWDFLDAGGHRVKLEISARLIERGGRNMEVEGIARDITERRRLEREILEISNREQRRIGHDLHDGVCQQLAAITYLVDILGDQLRGKEARESAEADRIGNLINEANAQARSVARGLFPVRLEEHGLVLALEELAASAAGRYRITCRFVCPSPPPKVDAELELHLYYIAQEALLNAIKHGKAAVVVVTLSKEDNRFKLSIQDNGNGFQPSEKTQAGMGIGIMRYRAKVIGATLDLHSQPNSGTEISCVFNPAARDLLPMTHGNGNS